MVFGRFLKIGFGRSFPKHCSEELRGSPLIPPDSPGQSQKEGHPSEISAVQSEVSAGQSELSAAQSEFSDTSPNSQMNGPRAKGCGVVWRGGVGWGGREGGPSEYLEARSAISGSVL